MRPTWMRASATEAIARMLRHSPRNEPLKLSATLAEAVLPQAARIAVARPHARHVSQPGHDLGLRGQREKSHCRIPRLRLWCVRSAERAAATAPVLRMPANRANTATPSAHSDGRAGGGA